MPQQTGREGSVLRPIQPPNPLVMTITPRNQLSNFGQSAAFTSLRIIALALTFFTCAHARGETSLFEEVSSWWPNVPVVGPSAEKYWEERKQNYAKKGKVSGEVKMRLDQAKLLRTLPDKEQQALLALQQHQSFPWIRIEDDKKGNPTVTSIDLSGRGNLLGFPELQARFATKVSNETIPLLVDLPNLVAVFAFDTLIDDAGVEQMAQLPKLRVVWLPPLATDEGLRSLAKAKEIEWLCWAGCNDINGLGLDAWKGHAKLRTIHSWHIDEINRVAELAKELPALVEFKYGDRNLARGSTSTIPK